MALATEDTIDSDVYSYESVTSPPFIPTSFQCVLTRELASGTIPFPAFGFNTTFSHSHPTDIHCHIYNYQHGVNTTVYLGTGWYYFALLEKLREGDILYFHLSVSGNFPLFVVQVSHPQQL
ncbi:hypothetical protein ACFE04_020756 [Oxalis oulophora]